MRILIKSAGMEVINGKFRVVAVTPDGIKWVKNQAMPTYLQGRAYAEIMERLGSINPAAWTVATAPTVFKTREGAEAALNDPETQKVYPTWRTVYMVATRAEYAAHIMENVDRAIEPKGDENDDNN